MHRFAPLTCDTSVEIDTFAVMIICTELIPWIFYLPKLYYLTFIRMKLKLGMLENSSAFSMMYHLFKIFEKITSFGGIK